MKRKPARGQINHVLDALRLRYGLPRGGRDPFRVLVATVVSQRCRDEVTDEVTERLFERFEDIGQIARASLPDLEGALRKSGLYRQKALRIREIARTLLAEHGGGVPDTLEALTSLPGVGRKTANCVLNYGFGREAIAVDTHVHRITNRLGWVKTRTPDDTEKTLMLLVPRNRWAEVNSVFVDFGREICAPRRPRCHECPFKGFCPTGGKNA
ncbi:MAG: endonuclease III [bacterium]